MSGVNAEGKAVPGTAARLFSKQRDVYDRVAGLLDAGLAVGTIRNLTGVSSHTIHGVKEHERLRRQADANAPVVEASPVLVELPLAGRPVLVTRIAGARVAHRPLVAFYSPLEAVKLVALGVECTADGPHGSICVFHDGTRWRGEWWARHKVVEEVAIENGGQLCDIVGAWWIEIQEGTR